VILTTAYSEYALEGYELDVADYLLKPIIFDRFLKSVEKVSMRLNTALPTPTEGTSPVVANANTVSVDYIFVKDGTKLVKIRLNEILFVEGLKDYVMIHTPQQKIVSLQRMKTLEEQLPENQFVRIHNSYIVSLEAMDAIHKEKVQVGAIFLPISDTYRKSFKDFIERNNVGKLG
jgi:DNA-binding LytR/AlgR family response regulator